MRGFFDWHGEMKRREFFFCFFLTLLGLFFILPYVGMAITYLVSGFLEYAAAIMLFKGMFLMPVLVLIFFVPVLFAAKKRLNDLGLPTTYLLVFPVLQYHVFAFQSARSLFSYGIGNKPLFSYGEIWVGFIMALILCIFPKPEDKRLKGGFFDIFDLHQRIDRATYAKTMFALSFFFLAIKVLTFFFLLNVAKHDIEYLSFFLQSISFVFSIMFIFLAFFLSVQRSNDTGGKHANLSFLSMFYTFGLIPISFLFIVGIEDTGRAMLADPLIYGLGAVSIAYVVWLSFQETDN